MDLSTQQKTVEEARNCFGSSSVGHIAVDSGEERSELEIVLLAGEVVQAVVSREPSLAEVDSYKADKRILGGESLFALEGE